MSENEQRRYVLTDEDGNTFEGVEVLTMGLKSEEDGEEIEILLLEDSEGAWFPFVVSDEGTSLTPVEDDDIIAAIEDTLDLIAEAEDSEE